MKWLHHLERLAWTLGIVLIAGYGVARVHGAILKQQDLARFEGARLAASDASPDADPVPRLPRPGDVDHSLWSPGRIEKYEKSLEAGAPIPLALLRIPKIDLEVPVLDGTDAFALNRGVGRIESTARPGEPGNIGIAGHRDGFFRGLKDIHRGDAIELVTLHGIEYYVVEHVGVVEPDAVEVLNPTEEPTLTLVTCYPFYFVGAAPQRYVVRAVRTNGS